ncbi:hypothetical protein SAMN05444008_101110 [Cnuella takakiae]|uniref:Uncharacterized protein n=1 Tax=Cnuella takakiae TaxID=1302690 RepID=A0A1M4SFQ5_9BACT|nr:hypothetical protein BUE76_23425 [Cnuella takakiae]SHE31021.1 hypothetical protein SAMN05444008_101110 [Cnuella takakiae]
MVEYNILLASLNNPAFLNKALQLGRITVKQYFQDKSFYFYSYNRYLEQKWGYQRTLAGLYKFFKVKRFDEYMG